jgi:hypothetical protein
VEEAEGDIVEEAEGDIANCESDPGKLGSLSVSSYCPYSMRAIHYVPLGPSPADWIHTSQSSVPRRAGVQLTGRGYLE